MSQCLGQHCAASPKIYPIHECFRLRATPVHECLMYLMVPAHDSKLGWAFSKQTPGIQTQHSSRSPYYNILWTIPPPFLSTTNCNFECSVKFVLLQVFHPSFKGHAPPGPFPPRTRPCFGLSLMTKTGEELLSYPGQEAGREWTWEGLEILRAESCMVVRLPMREYGVGAERGHLFPYHTKLLFL